MLTTTVVTTFNEKGYNLYAKNMIDTFIQYWPQNTILRVYAENVEVQEHDRVQIFNLESEELNAFKQRYLEVPAMNGYLTRDYNYNFDAVRFCHKVFAQIQAIKDIQSRYMIYLDADVVTIKDIPQNFIEQVLPKDRFVAYLGRLGYHSETGFIAYDLTNHAATEFFQSMLNMYLSAEIFNLLQWSDSFVFDTVKSVMVANGKFIANNLSQDFNVMHPFVNSILGEYMDHLKGPKRKSAGKSFSDDYIIRSANAK